MPKKQDLNSLQKTWYKKLKDEGFDDIEQDEDNLKKWSSTFNTERRSWALPNGRRTVRLMRQEYYRLAGYFFWDHKFDSAFERKVWELHAEGLSFRDIAKELKDNPEQIVVNKDKLQLMVKKLAEIMIKRYSEGQEQNE